MICTRKYEEYFTRYASKVYSYLVSVEAKKSFVDVYEEKYLERESEATKNKALIQGRITGQILAKKGAREFGEELDNQQEEQQQSRKDINTLFESDGSDELEDDETIIQTFRNRIFNFTYQYFKGDTSLHLIRELNKSKERFNPKTLGGYLDVVSYELISKDMDYNEKNALK